MRIAVVHLSDIHIRKEDDPILARTQKIAAAARGVDASVEAFVLVLSGDVAFSGTELEYQLASTFIQELKSALADAAHPDVPVIVIPGNHDCDFTGAHSARTVMIGAFSKGSSPKVDESIEEICLEVQRSFFEFRDSLDASCTGKLYYEYTLAFGSRSILFRCLNSAWLSQLKESPGTLYFPEELIPDGASKNDLVVSLLHHPYNWFRPEAGRSIRTRLEKNSDIILTGHEHIEARRSQARDTGELNQYIEAAVLQDSTDPAVSGFNVILLDLDLRKQRFVHFALDDDRYIRSFESPDWEDFQVSRLRMQSNHPVAHEFQKFLDDPGVSLNHPDKGNLILPNVFVYPDIGEVSYKVKHLGKIFDGAKLLEESVVDGKVLISGGEQSGKTCLAKTLFRTFHGQGRLPVFLDGSTLKVENFDRLQRDVEATFLKQYAHVDVETWRQTATSQRILIVDNFHLLQSRLKKEHEMLEWMERLSGRVFLLANDLAQHVMELISSIGSLGDDHNFHHYRLLEFGHLKRNELIEKWFLMDTRVANDEAKLAHQIVQVARTVDTLLGRNYLPAYPVFLLSVLQAHESNRPVDTSASTYGYFYEIFIRGALASKASSVQYDIRTAYLAFLAYHIFTHDLHEFTLDEWDAIHREYQKVYAVQVSFETLKAELMAGHAIESIGDVYRFKYSYAYYYFVASYLKDHINETEVRVRITQLSQNIHVEDAANILLFLAHLSKDPFIIEQMLVKAEEVFSEFSRATLDEKFTFLEGADSVAHAIAYEEEDLGEARRKRLASIDQHEREQAQEETEVAQADIREEFQETDSYLSRFGAAFRTVQILGQILKNFPGSLPADKKLKLANACYGVGLRALSSTLTLFERFQEDVLRFVVDRLREENPSMTKAEIASHANRSVFGLAHMLAYGTVTRIAHAVGSPQLTETFKALRSQEPSTAVGLIHLGLQLEQSPQFPQAEITRFSESLKSRPWPMSVLRQLVVNHFHVFSVNYQVKQSVCAKLGIPYKPLPAHNPRARLG